MIPAVKINQLSPKEWHRYKALRLQAVQEEPLAFTRTYEEELALPDTEWQSRLERAQEGVTSWMVFAELDGEMVGMMAAFSEEGEKARHRATIASVYVAQKARGKGVARLLMQELLQILYQRFYIVQVKLTVRTTQVAAIRLYEDFGFEVTGALEKSLYVDGHYYDAYLMVKIIKRDSDGTVLDNASVKQLDSSICPLCNVKVVGDDDHRHALLDVQPDKKIKNLSSCF